MYFTFAFQYNIMNINTTTVYDINMLFSTCMMQAISGAAAWVSDDSREAERHGQFVRLSFILKCVGENFDLF